MPDLAKVIPYLSTVPDVWIRDSETDDGTLKSETHFDSPDIVVMSKAVSDPQSLVGIDNASLENLSHALVVDTTTYVYFRLRNTGGREATATIQLYGATVATVLTDGELRLLGVVDCVVPNNGNLKVSEPVVFLPSASTLVLMAIIILDAQPSLNPKDFANVQGFARIVGFSRKVAVRSVHLQRYGPQPSNGYPDQSDYDFLKFRLPAPRYHLSDATADEKKTSIEIATDFPQGTKIFLEGPRDLILALGSNAIDAIPPQSVAWIPVSVSQPGTRLPGIELPTTGADFDFRLLAHLPDGIPANSYRTAIRQFYGTNLIGGLTWISVHEVPGGNHDS
jgi:hypothetical protein